MLKIITISGLDGSGKSTQIKLLKNYLEKQDKKVFYFHIIEFGIINRIVSYLQSKKKYLYEKCFNISRSGDIEARSVIKKTVAIKPVEDKRPTSQNSVTSSNQLGIWLRKIALRIDIWRFKRLVGKLKKQNYNYILSDRFFYDVIANIEYLSKKEFHSAPLIPKPDLSIYLQTDPEIIMTRSNKVPDQGLRFLQDKKKILDQKKDIWNWITINNTHKNKSETAKEIKNTVNLLQNNISKKI